MRFWNKSLMARLVTYFLTLSAIGITVTTLVTLIIVRNALTRSIYDQLEAVATLKEDEMNRWINDQRDEIAYMAVDPDLVAQNMNLTSAGEGSAEYENALERIREMFSEEVEGHPSFSEMFLMSSVGGKVLVSTERENEGQYRVSDSYYTQGRLGLYTQNVYTSPQTGRPAMTISAPVHDAQGNLIGVVALHLNLERLDGIILQRAGLGETGETYIVDRFNNFISAVRSGEREYPRGVHTQGIDAALQGQDGSALYINYNGVPVIGVYRWMDERQTALLAEISQREALAPIQRVAAAILVSGLSIAAVLAVGVFLLSRQIARPVRSISEAANQMAAGDLNARALELTQDEIGTLAVSFNAMAGQIRQLVEDLEQRVAERTAELEDATRQSERRARELQTISEASRAITAEQDLEKLLATVTRTVSERFDFYHVGIFLLDSTARYAVLRATNSAGGQKMLERGHRLEVGKVGIVGNVAATGAPRIALDVGADAVFFNNPDLPETRSEMALPLRVHGRIIGVLDVQSTRPNAFTRSDANTLGILADQVAIAIENARLLKETQQALTDIQSLYSQYLVRSWAEGAADGPIGYQQSLSGGAILTETVDRPEIRQAIQTGKPAMVQPNGRGAKKGQAPALAVPIRLHDQVIGVLDVQALEPDRQWKEDELSIVEAIAERLALALENARLLEDAQQRAERERLVSEITTKVRSTTDPQAMIQVAMEELQKALGGSRVHITPQVVSGEQTGPNRDGRRAVKQEGKA